MKFLRVIKEVLTPGAPEFKAQLSRLSDHESVILKCLQLLEEPAIQDMKNASDEAAEF